jgi:hypothetical protein
MGWMRTIFLGDIGNRLDIEDTECGLRQLRQQLDDQSLRDRGQDDRLAILERENTELKLCLGALMRTLVAKGVCSREELEALAVAVEDAS